MTLATYHCVMTVVVLFMTCMLQADEAGAAAGGEEDEDLMVDLSLKKKKKKKKVTVRFVDEQTTIAMQISAAAGHWQWCWQLT